MVRRGVSNLSDRTALLAWASGVCATVRDFRRTVLVGALGRHKSAQLWKLSSLDDATNAHFKSLVADFVGVPHGVELRNLTETRDALMVLLNPPAAQAARYWGGR